MFVAEGTNTGRVKFQYTVPEYRNNENIYSHYSSLWEIYRTLSKGHIAPYTP